MRTKSLILCFLTLMSISLISCKQVTGQVTWQFTPSPEGTTAAQNVTNQLENQMRLSYESLGKYRAPFTDGSAYFNGAVKEIKGETFEDIRNKVAANTTSMARALDDFKFSGIDSCKIVVTLFVNNSPTEVFNKTYLGDRD